MTPEDGWIKEADDLDAVLRLVGLDPQTCRTDGGSMNIGRVQAALSALRQPVASDDLRQRCAEILEWQTTGILKGEKLREFAAKQRWADDPHVLMIAERETAREAFEVLATPPPAPVLLTDAWQPISTAPKDGTEILLSNGETVAQGNWLHAEPYIREKRDLEGRYVDQEEFEGYDGWIDSIGGMQPDPTHWMPLPPPPAALAGDTGTGEAAK